jgi:VanZ family protein
MHMIAVSSESEERARRAIAHIPSEIIFSPTPSAPSRSDRITAWIQILAIIIILLVAIYQSFF